MSGGVVDAATLAAGSVAGSAAVAGLAYAVHRGGRHPVLAHLLWMLVLVKAIVPPILVLPLLPDPRGAIRVPPTGGTVTGNLATGGDVAAGAASASPGLPDAWLGDLTIAALVLAWALGSVVLLAVSLVRIRRIDRLVKGAAVEAPVALVRAAGELAARFGLTAVPVVALSKAELSPMTWWTGGRARIVIPRTLAQEMEPDGLRWVIAHEIAHISRRDHLVRWLEWVACVAVWWNPVVWWARRHLRVAEEVSCDALVVARLGGGARAYARTILAVVEYLADTAMRPPSMATGIDASETLERRFRMLTLDGRAAGSPRRLGVAAVGVALAVMTLGLGWAPAGRDLATLPVGGLDAHADPGQGPPVLVAAPSHTAGDATSTHAGGETAGAGPQTTDPGEGMPAGSTLLLAGEVHPSLALGPRPERHRGRPARGWDSVVVGSPRSDRRAGSAGRDLMVGGAGEDILSGLAGRDLIRGGGGSDVIRGGGGRDVIRGGGGDDLVLAWQDGRADAIDCGPGDGDRAVVDPRDTVVACETVVVRQPAARS